MLNTMRRPFSIQLQAASTSASATGSTSTLSAPFAAISKRVGMAARTSSSDTEPKPLPISLRSMLRSVAPDRVIVFPALSPTSTRRVVLVALG